MLGFRCEEVDVKFAGTTHNGPCFGQELFIAAIEVVLIEVLAKPSVAGGPDAVIRAVNSTRRAPDIGVVVERPTATTVHGSTFTSCFSNLADKAEHRLVHLGQSRYFCRPVVHLKVDVGRVFAVPRRKGVVVPDALQVGGLSAGLRAADEQVAPELEIEFDKLWVVVVGKFADSLVGGKEHTAINAQEEVDTIEE